MVSQKGWGKDVHHPGGFATGAVMLAGPPRCQIFPLSNWAESILTRNVPGGATGDPPFFLFLGCFLLKEGACPPCHCSQ